MYFPSIENLQFSKYKTIDGIRKIFIGYSDYSNSNNTYSEFEDIPINKEIFNADYQNITNGDLYLRLFLSAIGPGSLQDNVIDWQISNLIYDNIIINKAATNLDSATQNTLLNNRYYINCGNNNINNIITINDNSNKLQFDFKNGFTEIRWQKVPVSTELSIGLLANTKYYNNIFYRNISNVDYVFQAITTAKNPASSANYNKLNSYMFGYTSYTNILNADLTNYSVMNYDDIYTYDLYVNIEIPDQRSNIIDYYGNMTETALASNNTLTTYFANNKIGVDYLLSVYYTDATLPDDFEKEFTMYIPANKTNQRVLIETNLSVYQYSINEENGNIEINDVATKYYKLDKSKWSAKIIINDTTAITLDDSAIELVGQTYQTNILSVGAADITTPINYNPELGYLKLYAKAFTNDELATIFRREALYDFYDKINSITSNGFIKTATLKYSNSSTTAASETRSGSIKNNNTLMQNWLDGNYGNSYSNAEVQINNINFRPSLTQCGNNNYYYNNFKGWSTNIAAINDNEIQSIPFSPIINTPTTYYCISLAKIIYHFDKSTTSSKREFTINNYFGSHNIKSTNDFSSNFVKYTETGLDGTTKTFNVIGWTTSSTVGNHTEYNESSVNYLTNDLHLYPIYKRDAYSYTVTNPIYEYSITVTTREKPSDILGWNPANAVWWSDRGDGDIIGTADQVEGGVNRDPWPYLNHGTYYGSVYGLKINGEGVKNETPTFKLVWDIEGQYVPSHGNFKWTMKVVNRSDFSFGYTHTEYSTNTPNFGTGGHSADLNYSVTDRSTTTTTNVPEAYK